MILSSIPGNTSVVADAHGAETFMTFMADNAQSRHVFSVGELVNVCRFTCCYRFMPFWMKPQTGRRAGDIPVETQYLLAELSDGKYALFVPLLDGAFRATLQGSGENSLDIVVESGDPAVAAKSFCALFVAVDPDPYRLMEESARSVMAQMQTGRLRRDKPLPSFIDQFGWCTWDSFYREVSQDKVRSGLESFASGGVVSKLLILDDGWQSVRAAETEELRLTAFAANEKFDGDLTPTVQMAKAEFGVETFIAWHALTGYYGGVEPDAIADYDVRLVPPQSSPGVLQAIPNHDEVLGTAIGLVAPDQIYLFFHEYHKTLRLQGVDGVKVDVQSIVESIGEGSGGRVELMRSYHEALEGSVQTHFLGNVINCMSCTNEMLYSSLNSTLRAPQTISFRLDRRRTDYISSPTPLSVCGLVSLCIPTGICFNRAMNSALFTLPLAPSVAGRFMSPINPARMTST